MQTVQSIVFLGGLAFIVVHSFMHARALQHLASFSHSNQFPIFGTIYKNTAQACGDIGLLNKLWVKNCWQEISSPEAAQKVRRVHKLLRVGIYGWITVFAAFIVCAVVSSQ